YHYLTRQTQQDLKITHVFQTFRDWWSEGKGERAGGRDIVGTLEQIGQSACTFRSLLEPAKATRWGILADRLLALDTTTVYPFLLYLDEWHDQLGEQDFSGILTDIESYLVRRAVCG